MNSDLSNFPEPTGRCMPREDKQLMLIINPVAGKGEILNRLPETAGIFMDAGYRVSLYPTRARGDATEYVRAYGSNFDMICCSGGDGTVNETVSGLVKAGLDIPIGYLPAGSTNDFAEFHGLSLDPVLAAINIVSGTEHKIDVGQLNDKLFINAADFGAFTWLPYTTPQRLKNKLGFYAYVLDGIKDLAKLQSEHLRITINGQTREGEYAFGVVASSSELAGALDRIGQTAVADDGLFEVLLVRRPTSHAELQSAVTALREQDLEGGLVSFFRTDKVEIECQEELAWALDGEKCIGGSRHAIKMLPGRARIVY